MDPLSRRRVWALIDELKKNRIVLLTSHSMEEADALGDRIAILNNGRLRAVGTSLFLKVHQATTPVSSPGQTKPLTYTTLLHSCHRTGSELGTRSIC